MPEGMQPLITYSLNEGNINHALADQGRWLDGGLIHFHHELGEVLQQKLLESGMSPEAIQGYVDQAYVRDGTLKPHHLTQGGPNGQHLVGSWGKNDMIESEKSGSVPQQFMLGNVKERMVEQSSHGEVHAHQIAHMLPDTFYHAQTSGSGGRPKKIAEGQQKLSAGEELAQVMSKAGLDVSQYSPEELEQMGGTKAIKMLFSRTQGQKNEAGGAAKMALRHIFSQLGSSHKDPEYDLHRSNAHRGTSRAGPEYHGTANLRAADVTAHLSNLAAKYEDQGMSAEKAKQKAVNDFRNYEHQSNRYGPVEGLREKTEALIGQMMGAHGHEKFELGDRPTQHVRSGLPDGLGQHTEMPEGWAKRRVSAEHLPIQPVMPPTQRVVQQPMAAAPTGLPFGVGAPRDVSDLYQQQSPLFQTSDDIIMHGLDDIRKKMGYFDGFLRGF
jgi:hypothetical protein